jgi:alanyl-tRNA synthetase
MTSTEIRQSFLDLFKSKSHTIAPVHSIASSSSSNGTVAKLVAESLIA